MARACGNLGNYYQSTGEYARAIEHRGASGEPHGDDDGVRIDYAAACRNEIDSVLCHVDLFTTKNA